MFTLSRTVRFAVNLAGDAGAGLSRESIGDRDPNGYAGVPAMRGLGAFYELEVACLGEADPITGYVVSITDIDEIVRTRAIGLIADAVRTRPEIEPASLLPELIAAMTDPLAERSARLRSVRWRLSPFYSVAMNADDQTAATIRQRFEFSAAHRLHAERLSEEENRRIYGKCNNPSGHGHNYVVEPAVRTPLENGAPSLSLPELERLVERSIIDRFDHKNLSVDLDDFSGEVASVENIARRCYELLAPEVEAAGARLESLTVWETEKTSATYEPDAAKA